ncbi:MAG TPA: ABC transporter ATP-binding protein [Desulfobacteraceae bacterium]|nr:ABC transporter ATP-binding protein [Desulfobacteraceae bacterium]
MIKLQDLTKVFQTPEGTDIVAADKINMEVETGEICILIGPSGCGKTTTLKMVNRLIQPTSGKIYINGKDVTQIDTIELRRQLGYVIQQIGLFPNLTIKENVGLVPKLLKWDKKRINDRTVELLEMMALDPAVFADRYPRQLSGGQQQRVGVARALAADPEALLMDEPFGAVDPINRAVIQDEFLKMQRKLKKTILFVSHDIDEAVKMGDKIAIFKDGVLEQYDTPARILGNPANDFVDAFVGADSAIKRLGVLNCEDAYFHEPEGFVTRNETVGKARELMAQKSYSRVVVLGKNGNPKGYITKSDIEGKDGKVNDHHHPIHYIADLKTDCRTALSKMLDNETTWLPVVDESGTYQGYINQMGITHALGRTKRA